ncbi:MULTISPECIES: hypothetical protein [Stenotrophomonas]|uniref:hypothetical protein n=1 Tax=Stenotrophomonas TaxID=40323 RepID=UPI0012E24176|nr:MULTISPECIES: hypothetical protein [Stenotrophomonas]
MRREPDDLIRNACAHATVNADSGASTVPDAINEIAGAIIRRPSMSPFPIVMRNVYMAH